MFVQTFLHNIQKCLKGFLETRVNVSNIKITMWLFNTKLEIETFVQDLLK